MRVHVASFVLALAAAASGAAAQAPARDAAAPAGTASIRGRVTLAGTDQGLARVEVRAATATPGITPSTITDASGRYELQGLPAGRYVVAASKPNFVRRAFGERRPGGAGRPIELADGQAAAGIDVPLQRAGVITGRVLDEFGDPMADVQVAVALVQFVDGRRRLFPAQGFSTSNDLGAFRLFGIAPGSYYVMATLRDFTVADSTDREGYEPTYFPGTGSLAEAQRITIAPGQVVSGLTLPLLPVRTSRISGVALDASGKPLAATNVVAMDRSGFVGAPRSATVKPDGTFTISSVTPGQYVVETTPQADGGTARALVTVTTGDIAGLQLVVEPPAVISGRVVVEGGHAPPGLRVTLSRSDGVSGSAATMKSDATFELKASSGHATIGAFGMATGEWRLKRVTVNGTDITDAGLDIPAGGAVTGVVVEMTARLPEVTGHVLGAAGEQVQDWVVVAFARDPRLRQPPTRYVTIARPSIDGLFHLRLPPGDYLAVALDDVEQGEWNDPEYLGRLEPAAVPLSIADGEKKTIDLTMAPAK